MPSVTLGELVFGVAFIAVVRTITRAAVARSQRRQAPREAPERPTPLLGVVLPRQRDGVELDHKIDSN